MSRPVRKGDTFMSEQRQRRANLPNNEELRAAPDLMIEPRDWIVWSKYQRLGVTEGLGAPLGDGEEVEVLEAKPILDLLERLCDNSQLIEARAEAAMLLRRHGR